MRMIINIAKAELRNLFYSPVAWFLLVVFLVQCGWFYTGALTENAIWQDILVKNDPSFKEWENNGFTRALLSADGGLMSNVLSNLFLFIPLLTMSLIGREMQSGTFRLLYSAPITVRQIVAGKYLAIMVFNLMLVLITGIFMITALFNIQSVDYGMLIASAIGLYLLTCTYTAIGMFMSALTTYQIVAALGTLLTIFCLNNISNLWQRYDFVRDLTWFLNLDGRAHRMLNGLLSTKDVFYFIIVSGMFIGFTLLKLKGSRELKRWYRKAIPYATLVVIVLMTGYLSSRPLLTGYWDTTDRDVNTIHSKTQSILGEMDNDQLEVTLYTNLIGAEMGEGAPESRNNYLYNVWEKYLRFKPDIKFNYVYYYDFDSTVMNPGLFTMFPGKNLDFIAEKMAGFYDFDLSTWLKPAAIRSEVDLLPENLRLVMALKYKGRTEYLRTFPNDALWPIEYHVAAALKRLLNPDDYPRLAFISGHYERSIYKSGEREFSGYAADKKQATSLVNLGFDTDTLVLDKEDIPENISTLVLADPKSELSEVALQKIRQYLDKGGNMLCFGEPGKQQMLNPVLQYIGVRLMDGQLVQKSDHETQNFMYAYFTAAGRSLLKDPSGADFKEVEYYKIPMGLRGAVPIENTCNAGFSVHSLANAEEGVWLKKGLVVEDSAHVDFNAAEGDTSGVFSTAMALVRKVNGHQQRIIVCGDADFLNNKNKPQRAYGIRFTSWLNYGEYPVLTFPEQPRDRLLTITGPTAAVLKIVYVYVLPALVLLAGTILLIRRKRK